jgi:hypothetical protein
VTESVGWALLAFFFIHPHVSKIRGITSEALYSKVRLFTSVSLYKIG